VDAHGMPIRMLVTEGATADCAQAGEWMEGIGIRVTIKAAIYYLEMNDFLD
jgi:hypothetical protein